MKRTSLSWVAVGAVVSIIGGCSNTERTETPAPEAAPRGVAVGTGGAGANLKSDDEFVRDMASKNLAKVELSRMALARSSSPEVRAFAETMIRDQGGAEEQLKSVVAGRAIDWPARLEEEHRETAEDLAEKQGADFDRDYARAMIEVHQDLAAKLESRLDVKSLEEWKTAAAGRTRGKSLPEPNVAMADVQVRPIQSNDETTMKVNQWAADAYPAAQKDLDTARTLENATKKRSTG